MKHMAGKVPEDMAALEAHCRSVGHKTASVVMSQAFGVPAFPVDTHIHRLAYRWTLSTGKSVERTEADLKKLFPEDTCGTRSAFAHHLTSAGSIARRKRHDPLQMPDL
jgi:endonuclease-3